jgi:hypothetical protein
MPAIRNSVLGHQQRGECRSDLWILAESLTTQIIFVVQTHLEGGQMNRQVVMVGAIIALVGSGLYVVGILWGYRYFPIDDVGFSLVLFGFSISLLGIALREAPSDASGQPQSQSQLTYPQQPQRTGTQQLFCATCGNPVTWIREHQKSYCYNCRRYV